MGLYQSFQQVFVTNSPALLAEGQTVENLAVGQVGFLNGKTYKGVTSPTYAKNKALFAVWGTPDINLGEFGSAPNENEYSKLIKGKLIKRFRAKSAQRPQTPLYTLGWSGDVSDTDTLFAKSGESKDVFIQLTGSVIDRLQDKTGLIRQFKTIPACVDSCVDSCDTINPIQMTLDLVKQINADKFIKKYIRAKALISDSTAVPPTETDCFKFQIALCDTGDARALGLVQAQYPLDKVVLISRDGATSTYGVVKSVNSTPTVFTSTGVFIPECPTCPSVFTLIGSAKVFQVTTANGVTVGNVEAAFTGETSVTLLTSGPQSNVFNVTFPVATTDASVQASANAVNYVAVLIGVQSNICQQTTPTTTAWGAAGTLKKQTKGFRITLADSICGTDRLADLQAAFPSLVISVVDPAGSCVHSYETTVKSQCYEVGCAQEEIVFAAPASFEGANWTALPPAAIDPLAVVKTGILFETSFFHKVTNECSFDAFSYENDVVHVQVSNYNPDFNADPCETPWVFKKIRGVKYPQGNGDYVRRLEEMSKMYDHCYRSTTPALRDIEGYSFQADPNKYYDEYVLEYDTKFFTSGGWSEQYTQSFSLCIFVPEGTGQALENTLNSYVSSAGIEEDGVAI